jgi:hypothetical protein
MIKRKDIYDILSDTIETEYQQAPCGCCEGSEIISNKSREKAADLVYAKVIEERRYIGGIIINLFSNKFPNYTFVSLEQAYDLLMVSLKNAKNQQKVEYDPEW